MRAAIGLCCALLAVNGWSEEKTKLSWVMGASLGITTLSFDEKLDADTTFNTFAVSLTAGLEKVYASINFADSLGSENVSEEDEIGSANRRDLDLTLGYRLTDHWTAFLGYKDGATDIDFRVRDSFLRQDESYKEDGFYIGTTYSHRFEKAGTLNFTVAFIQFNTDLKFTEGADEDEDDEEEPLEFDDLEGRFSGDSRGFSAGVSWVMPVGEKLAFRTQYKINQYELEVKQEGVTFEPDQRLSYFEIGLLYVF